MAKIRQCKVCLEVKEMASYVRNSRSHNGKETITYKTRCKACFDEEGRIRSRARARGQRRLNPNSNQAIVLRAKENSICADCGSKFPICCMDFDHRPERVKCFNLSRIPKGMTNAMVEDEISKCDIVCSNCHRIRTVLRRAQKNQKAKGA